MNIILATSDVKLNNFIIEKYEETYNEVNVTEVDFLEDVQDKVWDVNPDVIIISEKVSTRENHSSIAKHYIHLYQFVTKTLKDFETVFIVHSKGVNSDLVKKFIENEYYAVIPYERLDILPQVPQNKKDVIDIFGGVQEIVLNPLAAERSSEEDSFIEPPTKFAEPKNKDKTLFIPNSTDNKQQRYIYLPNTTKVDLSKLNTITPIVSLFWSPIPNVGVSSFIKALGYTLASRGKKVLIIELDWEYAKMARTTGLTHKDRHLKAALNSISSDDFEGIEGFIVNNQIAEEDLPYNYKHAKVRLRELPSSLFLLSRNADLEGYEEEPEFDDDTTIEKLFYYAKQAGFENILVDVPSSPQNVFTMLSMLCSNEMYAFVDENFSTSALFKLAMYSFNAIDIHKEDFHLIINKTREESGITAQYIAEYYEMNPVLSLPFDDEMIIQQLDLRLTGGKEYMDKVNVFANRYGINSFEQDKQNQKNKNKRLFNFNLF
ncbi:hypothetical protein [Calidifontibacillus erzurumensis]|uniref:hypothetical protein n=1 Tax=Calidifontibacillus erzurumensis TaxID=2741433 RepID=UPI0035B5426A